MKYEEEYMIGSQQFEIEYDYEEGEESTHDYPGSSAEITIKKVWLKCWDKNENEVWSDISDCYHEFFNGKLEEELYEQHYARFIE